MSATGINWGSLLGLAGSGIGSILGAGTQTGLNTAAQNAARNSGQLYNFGASGGGGIGGNYTSNGGLGGSVNLNYGTLNGPNSQLQGLAGMFANNAGYNQVPSALTNGANNAFGVASGNINPANANANNFYGAANTQLQAAGQNPSAYANGVYNNLTAQAKPWEDAQTAALQDSQFGKGQAGTSGGALQTQAFAQGLGTANLQRQITAQQMGQQQQQNAVANAGQLSGAGSSLLSNAFSNFNTTQNQQQQLAALPAYLQGLQLQNSGSALNQQGGIQQQALNLYNSGLATNSTNGQLLQGAAGQLSANANGQNTSQNPYGNLLQSIFGGVANSASGANGGGSAFGGVGNYLSNLFGGSSGYSSSDASNLFSNDDSYLNNTDFSGLSFNGAGGQAATSPGSSNSGSGLGGLGLAGGAFGVASGLASGNPTSQAAAGLKGAQLAARSGAFGSNSGAVNTGAGYGMNALGIYSGLKQGGVAGDANAAVNAAQLGSRLGAFGNASGAVGTAAGYVAAPLALYNAVNNYKSGATGSDALNGAEAGAAIGSIIPGVGTIIGGVVGGAVGAIASAFGPGAKDPETVGVNKLIDAVGSHPEQAAQLTASVQNPYVAMAGLFDRHESTLPVYQQYGRMGEQKFTNDLISKVQTAKSQGMTDPSQVYNSVIAPWVGGMGKGWSGVGSTYQQTTQGLIQNMTYQVMSGTYQQNFKAIGGQAVFAPAGSASSKTIPAFSQAASTPMRTRM